MGFIEYFEKNRIFIAILSLFSIFRIYLGMKLPIWLFPNAVYDDMLMFEYSDLATHFSSWNIQSLSKDIAYPIFLFFVKLSHIPYRFWMSLLWIIAAILVIYGIYKFLSKNKRILLFSFVFVLFLPVAFDILCGQRVYRNAIITPVTIIFLSMLYIFINNLLDYHVNIKNTVIWGILLGLTFTFNYYVKEDGILTLPILVVCIFAVLLYKLFKEDKFSLTNINFKKSVRITFVCIIPLLIFVGGTFAYQEINDHYFGVADINTRTSGQIGEFYANLLKIDDPNKSVQIWIPASTVEKAANASPTLQSHPKFVNAWLDTPWNGGTLRNSEIKGDLTEWSLRAALKNVSMYNDEKSASDFFFKVNNELDSAFKNGTLEKSDNIFITSSANGKNMTEILALEPYILTGLDMTLFYKGFELNHVNNKKSSFFIDNGVTYNASHDIHDSFTLQSDLKELSSFDSIPIKLIELDLTIYRIVSYVLFLASGVGFIFICINQFRNKFKNKNINLLILFNVMLFGTVLVQVFAIAWFCSYLGTNPWVGTMDDLVTHIKFHLVSAYGFYTMFVVLSLAGVFSIMDKIELKN